MLKTVLAAVLVAHVSSALSADVRLGDHPEHTRIVFDASEHNTVYLRRADKEVKLDVATPVHLPATPLKDRTVHVVRQGLDVDVAPGIHATVPRVPGPVVPDIHDSGSAKPKDPRAGAPVTVSAVHDVSRAAVVSLLPGLPEGLIAYSELHAVPTPSRVSSVSTFDAKQPADFVASTSAATSERQAGKLAAKLVEQAEAEGGIGLAIPTDPFTGVAAFVQRSILHVVFDTSLSIALPEDRASGPFQRATLTQLEVGSELVVPVPHGERPSIFKDGSVWTIAFTPEDAAAPTTVMPLEVHAVADGILFRMVRPGSLVHLRDQSSGVGLIVATDKQPDGGVVVPRLGHDRHVRSSLTGVVVEWLSDAPVVKGTSGGVIVGGPPVEATASDRRLDAGASYTRVMNLVAGSSVASKYRQDEATVAVARAPHGRRGPALLDAAQAALARANPREASALAHLAQGEGLNEAQSYVCRAVEAVSNVLDANGSSQGIPPLVGHSDEEMLWRAVEQAQIEPSSPVAATLLEKQLPLLLDYPEPLQRALTPVVARTLTLGGTARQAALTDRLPQLPLVTLYRAARDVRQPGRKALEALDQLVTSNDPAVAVPAAVAAVDEHVRRRELSPAQAAAYLTTLFIPSRAIRMEPALRLRAAHYLEEAGASSQALKTLRETVHQYPASRTRVQAALQQSLDRVMQQLDRNPTLDGVALVQANLPFLPHATATSDMQVRLANAYAHLGLLDDADALLRTAIPTAGDAEARRRIIRTLARDRAAANDAKGVDAAVGEAGAEPDDALVLVRADVAAQEGNPDAALSLLSHLRSPEADRRRVDLLEKKGDWIGALSEQQARLAVVLPPAGPLDHDQGAEVLRLARLALHAGDAATLSGIRRDYMERLRDPERRVLQLLAMKDADGEQADLRSVGAFAEGMPAALEALKAR